LYSLVYKVLELKKNGVMRKAIQLIAIFTLLTACSSGQDDSEFALNNGGPNGLREGAIEIECGETKNDCNTLNYEIPVGFIYPWSQMFHDGDDVYVSLLKEADASSIDSGEWCLFKNEEELLCKLMNAGTDGPIVEMVRAEEGIIVRYLKLDESQNIRIVEFLI
jgi:hypothetical protein